jgi:hypothetical protein
MLDFYSDLSAPIGTKSDAVRWRNVLAALDQLKLISPTPVVAAGAAQ